MTARDDGFDELRMVLHRHPEQEERCLGADVIEDVEDRVHLALDRRPHLVPAVDAEPAVNELLPVFEIDAEQSRLQGCTIVAATYRA